MASSLSFFFSLSQEPAETLKKTSPSGERYRSPCQVSQNTAKLLPTGSKNWKWTRAHPSPLTSPTAHTKCSVNCVWDLLHIFGFMYFCTTPLLQHISAFVIVTFFYFTQLNFYVWCNIKISTEKPPHTRSVDN